MTVIPATVRCFLLDIEGTVTPLSFVHDALFPYARIRIREFLKRNRDQEAIQSDLAGLHEEHATDVSAGRNPPAVAAGKLGEQIDLLTAYVHWLMDQDRKSTALKSLQGKIWKEGYERGDLQATLFSDVQAAFERWRKAGAEIAIFSSGSVLAQQMLFAHTTAGDLTSYISTYFDTNIGPKIAFTSYEKITAQLKRRSDEILFTSDSVDELDAAHSAGMQTRFSVRPGNKAESKPVRHDKINSFDEIKELLH